jgi:hypothetical protein
MVRHRSHDHVGSIEPGTGSEAFILGNSPRQGDGELSRVRDPLRAKRNLLVPPPLVSPRSRV